jgi:phospholipid/cholesterol/gamma-HCH transport system substrate-binding protein
MYDYVKQLTWAKLKVGIVITTAILIVFITVMFSGIVEKLFIPKVKIYAVFSDAQGLREGSPVWFSGVEVGSVQSIKFTPEQRIQVELKIATTTLKYLKKDSVANILTLGLLGDKYVEIRPGSKEAESLEAKDTISGITQVEIQDIVETGQESIASLNEFIDMLEGVLVNIEKGEGTVSKFLKDPSIYDNLHETAEELSDLVKKIKTGRGTLSRMINEDRLYQNVESSTEDIKLFTKRLTTSEGTVNRLIRDESLYDNINAVSEKMNILLESIHKGEGVMGSLVKDEQLSEELKITLKELNALIKDIKEHPKKYFKFSIF